MYSYVPMDRMYSSASLYWYPPEIINPSHIIITPLSLEMNIIVEEPHVLFV